MGGHVQAQGIIERQIRAALAPHVGKKLEPAIYFTTCPNDRHSYSYVDATTIREATLAILNSSGFAPSQLMIGAQTHAALEAEFAKRPRTDHDDKIDKIAYSTGYTRAEVKASLVQLENAGSRPLATRRDLQNLLRAFPQAAPRAPRR